MLKIPIEQGLFAVNHDFIKPSEHEKNLYDQVAPTIDKDHDKLIQGKMESFFFPGLERFVSDEVEVDHKSCDPDLLIMVGQPAKVNMRDALSSFIKELDIGQDPALCARKNETQTSAKDDNPKSGKRIVTTEKDTTALSSDDVTDAIDHMLDDFSTQTVTNELIRANPLTKFIGNKFYELRNCTHPSQQSD